MTGNIRKQNTASHKAGESITWNWFPVLRLSHFGSRIDCSFRIPCVRSWDFETAKNANADSV